ncbi:MAG: NfeD family protein [Oscillospiraceae bacterium]|nr:NfeD family protein [Oscillospiraceae bacterium]
MGDYSIVWAVAAVAFVIVEAATSALVSVWFIGGSVAALIASLLGAAPLVQIVLFFVLSGALLALLRPIAKRSAIRRIPTNADRIIGLDGVVTEAIDGLRSKGAIRVDGKEWTARASDGSNIPEGSVVRVDRIEGVKAFVTKKEEMS